MNGRRYYMASSLKNFEARVKTYPTLALATQEAIRKAKETNGKVLVSSEVSENGYGGISMRNHCIVHPDGTKTPPVCQP